MNRTKQKAEPIKKPSMAQTAREWLIAEFADGRNREGKDVWKKAKLEGIERRQLDDARMSLHFKTISRGRNGATWIPPSPE